MKAITIKGLEKNEAAFELDSGDTIIVTLTRRADAQAGFLLLQVDTEVIDPVSRATRYVLAHHEDSIQLAAIASPTGMQETMAYVYEAAGKRAANFLAAQTVLIDLPETATPGIPVTRDRSIAPKKKAPKKKRGNA